MTNIPNKIHIQNGIGCLEITQQNGVVRTILFDAIYLNRVVQYQWCYSNVGYARTKIDGQYISMHTLIMIWANKYKDGLFVDHIDGNTNDNRISNLRMCTHQENCRNTHHRPMPNHNSSDIIIGVRKDPRCKNSWRAQIYYDKGKHIEKTFRDKKLAIIQRLLWEELYFGEFAPQRHLFEEYGIYHIIKE